MGSGETTECITGLGHPNVSAIHPSTLMFTKERHLSPSGDCVVAVAADKGAADLKQGFKDALKEPNAQVTITIEADGLTAQVHAHGSPKLTLTNTNDMVIRKSDFISGRTLAIHSDKSSRDLPRSLIGKLRNPSQLVRITITVASKAASQEEQNKSHSRNDQDAHGNR